MGLLQSTLAQLVELQGGSVSVKSKVNEGSEFTVEMPFRLGNNQAKQEILPEHEEIEALNFSHVAVLIVEDNKVNQLLLKNMLKKFPCC